MTRPWFLHRRITYAFGLTTLLLSLALSVPFAWMVHTSIQDEIDRLHSLSDVDASLKRPPKVKVVWGAEGAPGTIPTFEAVIESVGIK